MRATNNLRLFLNLIILLAAIALSACDQPSPNLPSTPTSIPDDWIRIESLREVNRNEAESQPIIINNCDGASTQRSIGRGRSIRATINFTLTGEAEFAAPLLQAVKAKIVAQFGLAEETTLSADDSVNRTFSEAAIYIYTVQWYETWNEGTVFIDNLNRSFPYEQRVGYGANVLSSRRESCPTPSPSSVFSPTPIVTDTPTVTVTSTLTISPISTMTPTNDLTETAVAGAAAMTVSAVYAAQTATSEEWSVGTQAAMTVSAIYAATGTPSP